MATLAAPLRRLFGRSPAQPSASEQKHSAAERASGVVARSKLGAWLNRPMTSFHLVIAVATLLTIRRPFGILGMIAAVAGTATVWGIIQFLGAQRNLNTLNEHLAKLTEERKEYEALLEE